MTTKRFLTAAEAARELDVSLTTLYAYVSRGMIRSETTGSGRRERRYSREDVERLLQRKRIRRQPAREVREALHWGTPILESSISLITEGRLYYRGREVRRLAVENTIEEVAELLWSGEIPHEPGPAWRDQLQLPKNVAGLQRHLTELDGTQRFQALLPLMSAHDPGAYDLRAVTTRATGTRILRALALIAAGARASSDDIAGTLARSWAPKASKGRDLLNSALVLCADHELNISAFTARCVASAGSPLYSSVIAGIGALQGYKHGGYTRRTEALLQEIGRPGSVMRVLTDRLSRGEPIPGFGHKLYPDGDPRAATLLEQIAAARPASHVVSFAREIAAAVHDLIGEHPTIDFALVILTRVLGLPPDHALTIFALGRTAGWIGHAIEEYAANRLIRPRATYIGPQPDEPGRQSESRPRSGR
jgi:citrate synthase